MKKKKIVYSIIFILIISILSFGIYKYQNMISIDRFLIKVEPTFEEIDDQDVIEEKYEEPVSNLQLEYNNEDIIGTLEIENTDYKVPVLQGSDNSFYLKHLPNKEYSFMGSIFLDYRVDINNSRKLLIYGHNSSIYDLPFKILENYYDVDYLKEHKNVLIKSKEKIRKYEIFSLYIATDDYRYMNVKFTDSSYKEHVKYLKEKSMLEIDTNVSLDDNILILQTCSTHEDYLKYKKKYLVLVFHEIKDN